MATGCAFHQRRTPLLKISLSCRKNPLTHSGGHERFLRLYRTPLHPMHATDYGMPKQETRCEGSDHAIVQAGKSSETGERDSGKIAAGSSL